MIYIILKDRRVWDILSDEDKDVDRVVTVLDFDTEDADEDELEEVFGSKAHVSLHLVLGPNDKEEEEEMRLLGEKYKLD